MPDHLTRIQIFNPSQIQPPFCGRHVGDVGDPGLVRARRGERLCQEVVRHRQTMRRIRGGREPANLFAAEAQLLAQPLDASHASGVALVAEFRLEPLGSIGLARAQKNSVGSLLDLTHPRDGCGS